MIALRATAASDLDTDIMKSAGRDWKNKDKFQERMLLRQGQTRWASYGLNANIYIEQRSIEWT